MRTEIIRAVDTNEQKVFKLITIKTEHNELLFEGKFYVDSGIFKYVIDEEKLSIEIENIPNLLRARY